MSALTHHEVANYFQVSPGTIARLCEKGEMIGTRSGHWWFIEKEELDAFYERNKRGPEDVGVVYAFLDEKSVVRYVGQTGRDVWTKRIREHIKSAERDPETPFSKWLRSQIRSGCLPRVVVLKRCALSKLGEYEASFIREHASTVFNVTGKPA